MVAVHVYWSAWEVLTGSKVRVRFSPDSSLVSVCPEEVVHWIVGGEARLEATPTEQVRVSEPPAWTVGGASMVTVGAGRSGVGGRGCGHCQCHMTHSPVTVRLYTPCMNELVRIYSELTSDLTEVLQVYSPSSLSASGEMVREVTVSP